MIRLRLLLVLLVLSLSGTTAPAFAATKWLRADTHNFVIYSSGGRKELLRLAESVEQFDALLRLRTKIPREDMPNRLTIYMLAGSGDVARIMGDKKGMIAGVYMPRSEGSFAVTNRERADSQVELSGDTVLFHEYAHHYMFRYFSAPYPSWYIEGFAEFVSTAVIKDNGEWLLGKPAYHRAYGLLQTQKVPIDKLLFGVSSSTDSAASDAYYGRAWLLVHMLTMEPAWAGKLSEYFALLAKGEDPRKSAIAAFGDPKELDRALDRYLERSRVSVLSSKRAVAVDGAIQITELDALQSQLVLLSLKRQVDNEPVKTRDALKVLAQQAPTMAEAWFQLGLANQELARSEDDRELAAATLKAAEDAIDRALAIDPDHVRANVFKARVLFNRLQDAGDESPASWRKARAYVIRANAKANLDPEPLLAWYDSFPMQGREPDQNAAQGLALAFSLAPEASDIRTRYAFDLARQKQFDPAIRLIEILAYDPHRGEQGRALLDRLKRMRDGVEDKAESDKAKIVTTDAAPLRW